MSAHHSSASTSAAASANTAAAAAASAAPSSARGRSTHSSGAAASASGKRSAKPAAPLSASSLSGRKRTAAASAGSSSDAAVSAAPSSDQSASSASQSKKQRGESSLKQSNGSSAAATASSVGLDPVPAPSRRRRASSAASSSAAVQRSSGHDQSSDADKCAESDDDSDEEQEWKPAIAAAASASKPRPRKPRAPKPHRLFLEAKELIRGALPFAESQLSDDRDQRLLADVRNSIQLPASAKSIQQLGELCFRLSCDACYPTLPSEQAVLRRWFLNVDTLFAQLASLPRMKLTWEECHQALAQVVFVGALQAVPALVRRMGWLQSFRFGEQPMITFYCITPREHVVSLQPYLRLFELGLDPTEVRAGGDPLSALQLARNFVRDHAAPPASTVSGPLASMEAAVVKAEAQSIPSVLFARAIQQRESARPIEMRRRAVLHVQFMHALIPAWLAHSTKVRAVLLDAAPNRLIPPLVDIVSRYLDLDGVAPERSAPVDEPEEMA